MPNNSHRFFNWLHSLARFFRKTPASALKRAGMQRFEFDGTLMSTMREAAGVVVIDSDTGHEMRLVRSVNVKEGWVDYYEQNVHRQVASFSVVRRRGRFELWRVTPQPRANAIPTAAAS